MAAIIEGIFQPAALAQLVSSQLDVDRMDYLLRDSLMTGAKYGIYDLEWIINALSIDEEGDRIYVSARESLSPDLIWLRDRSELVLPVKSELQTIPLLRDRKSSPQIASR